MANGTVHRVQWPYSLLDSMLPFEFLKSMSFMLGMFYF